MGSDDSETEKRDRVLSPDDLDITAQPEVEEIDDGRYVVSPDGPAQKPDRDLLENPDWINNDDKEETAPQPTEQSPRREQSPQREQSPRTTDTQSTQNTQPPDNNQSTSRGQQPQSGNQPANRNQQPSGNSQSANRSQQSPTSGGGQQPSANDQSTNRGQQHPTQSTAESTQPSSSDIAAHDQPPVEPPAVELTNANVSKFLAEELTQSGGDYGFDATLNVEGQVNRGRMTSDDIGETLETLLRWYARQTTDEVEPESVLGIILAGSDLAVEYPVQSVYTVVKRHDLKPDDSISDLLAAVRKEGSFTVPPSKE